LPLDPGRFPPPLLSRIISEHAFCSSSRPLPPPLLSIPAKTPDPFIPRVFHRDRLLSTIKSIFFLFFTFPCYNRQLVHRPSLFFPSLSYTEVLRQFQLGSAWRNSRPPRPRWHLCSSFSSDFPSPPSFPLVFHNKVGGF